MESWFTESKESENSVFESGIDLSSIKKNEDDTQLAANTGQLPFNDDSSNNNSENVIDDEGFIVVRRKRSKKVPKVLLGGDSSQPEANDTPAANNNEKLVNQARANVKLESFKENSDNIEEIPSGFGDENESTEDTLSEESTANSSEPKSSVGSAGTIVSHNCWQKKVETLPKKNAWALFVSRDYASEMCTICFGDIQQSELEITDCGHNFHKECLMRALKVKQHCPICRSFILLPTEYPELPGASA